MKKDQRKFIVREVRYTHSLKVIRKRKDALVISLLITGFLVGLIVVVGFTLLDAKQFFLGFAESLVRVSIAYLISLIAALVISLILSASKRVEAVSLPILDVLQSFPSFALFPLLVLTFGKTGVVTIIVLFLSMLWPILFTIISAHKQIRQDFLEAATVFGAKEVNFLRFVLLPLLFPAIITGSIVAWGEAWEAIIAAEIIVNLHGVGSYLADLGEANNTQILVVGIVILLMLLYLINKYLWLPLLNMSTRYSQE